MEMERQVVWGFRGLSLGTAHGAMRVAAVSLCPARRR